MSEKNIGRVIQVVGPVLDIQFAEGQLPELLNAIEIDNHGQKLVVEVAQHTGDNVARCIAMSSTDGLVRGTPAVDTGAPLRVPVGDQCLGRVFNQLGEPVDNKPPPPPNRPGRETAPRPRPQSTRKLSEAPRRPLQKSRKTLTLILGALLRGEKALSWQSPGGALTAFELENGTLSVPFSDRARSLPREKLSRHPKLASVS